ERAATTLQPEVGGSMKLWNSPGSSIPNSLRVNSEENVPAADAEAPAALWSTWAFMWASYCS
ncbi:hypothetical protein A2U01_0107966, partial [Trifolium medium]|nr:hypothetical protein [Trifolium medium]